MHVVMSIDKSYTELAVPINRRDKKHLKGAYHSTESCQAAAHLAEVSWLTVSDYPAKKGRNRKRRRRWVEKKEDKHILTKLSEVKHFSFLGLQPKCLKGQECMYVQHIAAAPNMYRDTANKWAVLWMAGWRSQFPWCSGKIHQNCFKVFPLMHVCVVSSFRLWCTADILNQQSCLTEKCPCPVTELQTSSSFPSSCVIKECGAESKSPVFRGIRE